jgi:hypothetical protein
MSENHTCSQEKVIDMILNKIESFDSFKDILTEVKTLVSVQAKHSERLDALFEKQEIRQEKQDTALLEISNNMKSITEEQKNLKSDIRDLKSERNVNWVSLITKQLIPYLLGSGIIYVILKIAGKL